MVIPEPIQTFLMRLGFEFATVPMGPASDRTAPADRVDTVALVAEHEPILAVVPGGSQVDADRLRNLAATGPLRTPTAEELGAWYPECEKGMMPPLGPHYGQRVFVDEQLGRREHILFSGGAHGVGIRMRYADFAELVHPTVGRFAVQAPR